MPHPRASDDFANVDIPRDAAGEASPRRRIGRGAPVALALSAIIVVSFTAPLQNAVANGDTRTLSIVHTHTKEAATVTFKRNGVYDREALKKLNWLLRDWRRDEPTDMDPKLFDIVWAVHRDVGASEPVHVVSAYRSPQTNAALRRRSRAVAEHSQHMLGKAMDFYIPDADMAKVRAIGMRLQRGGVGYYPNSYSQFVHLDAGSVRSWPRMSRDQLTSLFPDGKTVHIPRDGKPLPGYDFAKAEILAAGGRVAGEMVADASDEAPGGRRRSFWAALFGGADEEEDAEFVRPASGRTRVAALGPTNSDDSRTFFLNEGRVSETPPAASRAPAPAAPVAAQPEPAEPAAPQVAIAQAPQPAPSPAPAPGVAPPPRPPEFARVASIDPAVAQRTGATPPGWQAGPAGQIAGSPGAIAITVMPEPPRRPGDQAPTGTSVAMPEPPRRPSELATLDSAGLLRLSGTGEQALPPAVAAYAVVAHPVPPPRPVEIASLQPIVPAAPPAPAPVHTAALPAATAPAADRQALGRLFDQAALAGPVARRDKVATVSATHRGQAAPIAPTVSAPPQEIVAGRFSPGAGAVQAGFRGKLVAPMAVVRFTAP